VGVNGSGKTTLLRTLLGLVPLVAGRLVTGVTVRAAYLSQEVTELPPALRVLEAVEQVRRVVELGGGRQLTASQLCERFGFTGDKQWTPVGDLSGGERRRLQLLRLLMDEPNVLVLDEPTNDLDIETLTALEDLLDDWPGTLLVVSHDRYFLERVCDRTVALLGDARLRELPGGVEEYLRRRRELAGTSRVAAAAQDGRAAPGAVRRRAPDAAGRRAPAADRRTPSKSEPAPSAGEARAGRKELARLERGVARLGQREAALHEELARQATDFERVGALDAELRAVVAEKDALEEDWLFLAERLD
jgi:ATP-binding cassette subfamily F protein uup